MGWDAILTLCVMAGAVALFVSEKLSVDIVAILALSALVLLGVVGPDVAISGFANEATITVAAMFVLSAGLQRTGALRSLGLMFARIRWPWAFGLAVMLTIATVSAFVNNTAAVAVFLPIVLAATAAKNLSPSKYLIPLSYAAQMGGVCTLIGTSTNLLVNSLAKDLGHEGFGLFDFAPLGLVTMAAGFVYLMVFRRWLLPHHPPSGITETYELGKYITELRVMPDSPLIGKSVATSQLAEKHSVYVLELLRGEDKHWAPRAEHLREGDVLLVRGDWEKLKALKDSAKLELEPEFTLQDSQFTGEDGDAAQVLVEAMVAPGARLIGLTLRELDFQWNYNATVLAVHRRGEVLREKIKDVTLNVGDVLLLLCPRSEMDTIRANQNLVVLNERGEVDPPKSKALLAIGIMAAAVGVAALGWLPIVASSILGGIALVATRCIGNDQAYQAIDWRVIVLLAGVLPLGIAMQKSGLAQGVADFAVNWGGGFGPLVVLAAVYLITALLTELMSNNAAAVLITPIAFSTALSMDVSPTPFLVAVLFAASTSFATPVGYQTNTMVYNAGNYRFVDFMKMGIPLNLLFWGMSLYFIPRFFPF